MRLPRGTGVSKELQGLKTRSLWALPMWPCTQRTSRTGPHPGTMKTHRWRRRWDADPCGVWNIKVTRTAIPKMHQKEHQMHNHTSQNGPMLRWFWSILEFVSKWLKFRRFYLMDRLTLLSKYFLCYFHPAKQIRIASKAKTGMRGLGGESRHLFVSSHYMPCELNWIKLALNHCSDQQNFEHNSKQ